MKQNKIRLLSELITMIVITPLIITTCGSYAQEIVVADNNRHKPEVNTTKSGVPVINLVKPTPGGVSHNQYSQFNVGTAGVVLNNSLANGTSQLVGALGANPNYRDQAANVILNEVTGSQASQLLGKQEIFGQKADYVLANPNGISCDGCGFINTQRTSLVVGRPQIKQGELQGYSTQQNMNALTIGKQGLTTDSALVLITPHLSSQGTITAPTAITALTGHNRVSYDLTEVKTKQPGTALDSHYLGGMYSGRIRLINTAKGSGVKLADQFLGKEEVSVTTPGDLTLQAAVLQGNTLYLSGNNIRVQGKINNHRQDINRKETAGNTTGVNHQQTLTRSTMHGKEITLRANHHNHLTAVEIRGENLTLSGGTLQLDGQQYNQIREEVTVTGNWWKQHNTDRKQEHYQQASSDIKVSRNASLDARKGDMLLQGAQIESGENLTLKSKGKLQLEGAIEKEKVHQLVFTHNPLSSANSGYQLTENNKDNLVIGRLHAGHNLGLQAEQDIDIKGSKLTSAKDMLIKGNQHVQVKAQKVTQNTTDLNLFKQWGGYGGHSSQDNVYRHEASHAAELTSGGHLLVSTRQNVEINGSKLKGKQGAFFTTAEGNLSIDNVLLNQSQHINQQRTSFTTQTKQRSTDHQQQSIGSELVSDADLTLLSPQHVKVIGSLLKSAKHLGIDAIDGITVAVAAQQQQSEQHSKTDHTSVNIGKHASGQYQAGLYHQQVKKQEKNIAVEQQGATLEGGTLALNTDKQLNLVGSQLITTQGDMQISGQNVNLLAAEERRRQDIRQVEGKSGLYLSAGLTQLGAGIHASNTTEHIQSDEHQAKVSRTQVAGNLHIHAKETLTQQGSHHQVQGEYHEEAKNIDHRAAENKRTSLKESQQVGVDISANTQQKIGANFVKKIATGQAFKSGASLQDLHASTQPDIGVELTVDVTKQQQESERSKLTATHVEAAKIGIHAQDKIRDQGTYYQANSGGITLTGQTHEDIAALDYQLDNADDQHYAAQIRVSKSLYGGKNTTAEIRGGPSSVEASLHGVKVSANFEAQTKKQQNSQHLKQYTRYEAADNNIDHHVEQQLVDNQDQRFEGNEGNSNKITEDSAQASLDYSSADKHKKISDVLKQTGAWDKVKEEALQYLDKIGIGSALSSANSNKGAPPHAVGGVATIAAEDNSL